MGIGHERAAAIGRHRREGGRETVAPSVQPRSMDTPSPPRAVSPFGARTMPNVLAVVGEHRDDPDHLLLLGEDGQHYDLRLADGATLPLPPAPGDEWLRAPAADADGSLTELLG